MRIHRVRLRNYRGVIDNTVEFPTEGVTIIEGTNETGKTCIPEAIDLILERLDSSRAKPIRDVKPVHRDEVPEVEIEVSTGDYRFLYRKRWLRRPETTLTITQPRPEQDTGRKAHDRVRRILEETLDHDLWRALRIEQRPGANLQVEMVLPAFNVPSLVEALDVAVGGVATGDGEDSLWRRISEEREKYWTATGRVKQERYDLKGRVEDARERMAELKSQLEEIELDATRVAYLRSDRTRLVAIREECERTEQELEGRRVAAERLRGRVERLEDAHREATELRDRIVSEQRRRSDLLSAHGSRNAELADLEAEARRATPAIEAAIAHSQDAKNAMEEAQRALRVAEADHLAARGDHEHHRSLIDYEQLQERWQRTIDAQRILRDTEVYLESAKVDDDLLSKIEEAHLVLVRAEAAVYSAGARLDGTALAAISMRIDGDEVTFTAGEAIREIVTQEMEILLPGVAELLIRAGPESKSLVTELNHARQEFHSLCASGGVIDLAEARQAVSDRKEAVRNRQEAITAIRRDLRDLTPEVMQEKIREIGRRIDRYAADRPSDPPLPATYEKAKHITTETKDLLDERRDQYRTLQADFASAAKKRSEQELRKATLEVRIGDGRHAVKEAERLLTLAREERSDSELGEDLRSAQDRVDDFLASLVSAREDLAVADPDSVQILLDNAQAASRRAAEELRRNEEEERELRASLKLRGEEGLYTRLGEAERQLRRVHRQYERMEGRADAAALLHAKFGARRQESQLRYHAPLTQRVEEFGRIVFGPDFKIELGDNLEVIRRTLRGVTLDVDHLSAGAREQLGLLSRLACAAIVSPNGGGAPVIIDDALGWSDPDRLSRMGAAIAAAGLQCQIIVLTCTPGRYAHVGSAKVIRVSA
nr:AAA family ATPase [bacterium]